MHPRVRWNPLTHALRDHNMTARRRLLHAYKANTAGLQMCMLYGSAASMAEQASVKPYTHAYALPTRSIHPPYTLLSTNI